MALTSFYSKHSHTTREIRGLTPKNSEIVYKGDTIRSSSCRSLTMCYRILSTFLDKRGMLSLRQLTPIDPVRRQPIKAFSSVLPELPRDPIFVPLYCHPRHCYIDHTADDYHKQGPVSIQKHSSGILLRLSSPSTLRGISSKHGDQLLTTFTPFSN